MKTRGATLMGLAFNGPDTSKSCAALGKLFAKDNSGYDFETIKKLTKYDEASLWFTLDRLLNQLKVVETYPEFPKGVSSPDKEVKIPYKFRIRKEFAKYLKNIE